MALRLTLLALGSRAKGYENRVMVYAHRRHRSWYQPPKLPHARSPLANKPPEEYGNTWDPRSGVDWYYRMRHRGAYRHWPWARWSDDPVRHHRETPFNRTFSHNSHGSNDGVPLWNYYAEVGRSTTHRATSRCIIWRLSSTSTRGKCGLEVILNVI
ncbi:hypothetical protein C3747_121g17 [Trypanosoma cruzi]|uniref:Uncharacterized protein n=1 Tax=Trypanosoma cruzi TaxID=5693 RepID=A0A2V2WCL4_TRYCR|nr:hypothetical protein C3747_121g17 [Trypanosoma cruzi]